MGKCDIRFISGTGKALRLESQEKSLHFKIEGRSARLIHALTHRVCVVWVGRYR